MPRFNTSTAAAGLIGRAEACTAMLPTALLLSVAGPHHPRGRTLSDLANRHRG
jgi:hypothetical protein